MAENYNGMAVGVFELDNLVACFVALDAASKAANVKIQSVERNRLKSGACVKMRGSSRCKCSNGSGTGDSEAPGQGGIPHSDRIPYCRHRSCTEDDHQQIEYVRRK